MYINVLLARLSNCLFFQQVISEPWLASWNKCLDTFGLKLRFVALSHNSYMSDILENVKRLTNTKKIVVSIEFHIVKV